MPEFNETAATEVPPIDDTAPPPPTPEEVEELPRKRQRLDKSSAPVAEEVDSADEGGMDAPTLEEQVSLISSDIY